MSITDELRAWANEHLSRSSTLAIADRIDAEHEAKVSYWQGACHKDGYDEGFKDGYDEGFASADDWLGQHEDAMAEHGWVRLPLDADGKPVRIGDVMAYTDNTNPMEVVAIVPPAVFLTEDGPRYADMCRHYHAPTVEDVLREFALACEDAGNAGPEVARIAAEYAKRLTLAEGEG